VAEEASDDAALVATSDRAFYAETLLGFMVTVHASAELRLQKFFKIFDLDLDVC
jgi:hypothetical protein